MFLEFSDIKIKKREIIFSVLILSVLLIIGILISNSVQDSLNKEAEKYRLAVKVDNDEEYFKYLFETSAGNVLASGSINAVDPVINPEINGEYLGIIKYIEYWHEWDEYVTVYEDTDGDGKDDTSHTEVVHHKEWKYKNAESHYSNYLTFMGVQFKTNEFSLPNSKTYSISANGIGKTSAQDTSGNFFYERSPWLNIEGDLRWYYDVIPKSYSGTTLVFLQDNKMVNAMNNDSKIKLEQISIEDKLSIVERSASNYQVTFWVFWIFLCIGVIVFFFIAENKWLDDKR